MPHTLPKFTRFVCFPEYFCFWPLILLGVMLPDIQKSNPDLFTDQNCALLWGMTMIVICNAVGQQFGRGTVAIIILLATCGYFGIMWYGSEHNVDPILNFQEKVNAMNLGITPDMLKFISYGLTAGFIWMILDVLIASKIFKADFEQIEQFQFLRGPKYYRNSRAYPARALLDDVLDFVLALGGMRVYAFEVQTGRFVCLGLAVGWFFKLDGILKAYAGATPVHDVGRQDHNTT